MAYTRRLSEWKDYPDTTTPIRASDLNGIEAGLESAAAVADTALTTASSASSLAGSASSTATSAQGTADTAYAKAQDALNAANAPIDSRVDAYVGPGSAGLAGRVEQRTRLVAPTGTDAANVTALQSAVDAAATAGVPLVIRGQFNVSGQVNIPSDSDIQFSPLTKITQTAPLTPVFVVNNVSNVTLRGLRVQGKTSDYVNNSTVYGAAAVRVLGTSSDILIDGGSITGMAGVGVFIDGATSGVTVRNVKMTGAGSTYILGSTYNYGAGVAVNPGASRWSVIGCDISAFAQGIVTGDNMSDVRILDNYVHDIPGQHAFYIETVNGCIISGNLVRNTTLLGMKVQIGTIGAADADTITISDNIFLNVGAQGILLDNPVGGSPRFRRVSITGNTVNTSGGHGIEVKNAVGAHVSDNIVYNSSAGIRIASSTSVEVLDNRVNKCTQDGINVADCTDWIVAGNRILDPGSALGASSRFGIHILGAGTTSDGTIRDNKVTDTLSKMRYGVYVESGDQTTLDITDNLVTGAVDYGARLVASSTARSYRNNNFNGVLGAVLNPVPSSTVDPYGGPGTHGLLGANFDPALAVANSAAMTAGVLYLHKVVVPQGGSLAKVWLTVGVAGAGLTAGQCLAGVYDSAGSLLGQSGDLSTTLNSTGNKAIGLTAATAVLSAGASVYVAILWNGTTSPQIRGISGSATAANINLAASASRWATAGSAQTSLPSTLPAMTASTVEQWVGVSA